MKKDNAPLVSICVPVYGVEKYIERCAISLFEQTYDNIEYIFVNDKTPDRSYEILLDVIKRYPDRKDCVKLPTHDRNRGSAAVRNTAANLATGEFIVWVDSDDYVEKNLVELAVMKRQEGDFDIVLYDYDIIQKEGTQIIKQPQFKSIEERTVHMLALKTHVSIWSGMYRMSLYKDNNVSCIEGLNNGEDYSVTPILSYYAKNIGYIDKVLYHYDKSNENSYSNSFSEDKYEQIWRAINRLESFFSCKGENYLNAIEEAKVSRIIKSLFVCLRIGGHGDYICKMYERLDKIDRSIWAKSRWYHQFFFYCRKETLQRKCIAIVDFVKKMKNYWK